MFVVAAAPCSVKTCKPDRFFVDLTFEVFHLLWTVSFVWFPYVKLITLCVGVLFCHCSSSSEVKLCTLLTHPSFLESDWYVILHIFYIVSEASCDKALEQHLLLVSCFSWGYPRSAVYFLDYLCLIFKNISKCYTSEIYFWRNYRPVCFRAVMFILLILWLTTLFFNQLLFFQLLFSDIHHYGINFCNCRIWNYKKKF
jgi:hypothetical protein